MTYRVIHGQFRILYPEDGGGCGGPRPDGDTIRFEPDNTDLVRSLAQFGGSGVDFKRGTGVNIRLEAVDALETHFNQFHQDPTQAEAARAQLLDTLGFTNRVDCANGAIQAADQVTRPGAILANGIDQHGRVVAFVYDEAAAANLPVIDGTELFVTGEHVDQSVNAALLAAGTAYPAWFDTLPAELRDHLAPLSRKARVDRHGLWCQALGHPGADAAPIGTVAEIQELIIVPVLFRRLIDFRNAPEGAAELGLVNFEAWLRDPTRTGRDAPIMLVPGTDPIVRADGSIGLRPGEIGHLHDLFVVDVDNGTMTLAVDPEDYVRIDDAPVEDPRPAPTNRSELVRIVAALPNPAGTDRGNETVTLINLGAEAVDLAGWSLTDARADRFDDVAGTIAGGDTLRLTLDRVQLGNRGDSVVLLGPDGQPVDRAEYTARDAASGRTVLV